MKSTFVFLDTLAETCPEVRRSFTVYAWHSEAALVSNAASFLQKLIKLCTKTSAITKKKVNKREQEIDATKLHDFLGQEQSRMARG